MFICVKRNKVALYYLFSAQVLSGRYLCSVNDKNIVKLNLFIINGFLNHSFAYTDAPLSDWHWGIIQLSNNVSVNNLLFIVRNCTHICIPLSYSTFNNVALKPLELILMISLGNTNKKYSIPTCRFYVSTVY